jgi:hypothetical protein
MRAHRGSALIERDTITHGPGAFDAVLMLLPRVTNAIVGASAHARRIRAHYVPSKRDRAKRSRVRQFVTTRW